LTKNTYTSASDKDLSIHHIKIACFGITFKPDVDDLRESPALAITQELNNCYKNNVLVVEPNIEQLPSTLDGAELVTIDTALSEADVYVFLVKHHLFIANTSEINNMKAVVDVVGLI